MKPTTLQKVLIILIKVFFIGLLLQFFLQTFVEFGLGYSGSIWSAIWLRKEIFILIFFIGIIYRVRKQHFWKKLFATLGIKRFIVLTILLCIFVVINGLFITKTGFSATAFSLRYSVTGFIIFITFSALSWGLINQEASIEKWYSKIIGWLLWGSLLRWGIIYFVPRLLDFVGYNNYNYEGDMNIAPPAAYYSQYNQGYVRNQFLFERPISWGFFLVAFWPLFFAIAIKRRGGKALVFNGGLYALAVLSTFSRAARIARFIQCGIIFLIEYRKNLKKAFLYGGIPLILIFGSVTYLGRDQIIKRDFSNTGHIKNIQLAISKIKQNIIFGEGPGTAGPASHHLGEGKEYNPENQFLQIWIEYGLVGFIFWIALYGWFMIVGFKSLNKTLKEKATKQQKYLGYLLFCLSLGVVGLSICGLVLHSFVDRMIVYPFMALFGIIYAQYRKSDEH